MNRDQLAGIPTSLGLLLVSIGYLIAMQATGVLEPFLAREGPSRNQWLWFSILLPAAAGLVSLVVLMRQTPRAPLIAAGLGVAALIPALAEFSFGGPAEFYIAAYAGVLFAAAHIIVMLGLMARR